MKKEMTTGALQLLALNYVSVQQACRRNDLWELDFNYRGTNYIVPVNEYGWYGITKIAYGNVEYEKLNDY